MDYARAFDIHITCLCSTVIQTPMILSRNHEHVCCLCFVLTYSVQCIVGSLTLKHVHTVSLGVIQLLLYWSSSLGSQSGHDNRDAWTPYW